jgi:endonuclease/exonuclease/phosphatase family metal-dependent hydrolase
MRHRIRIVTFNTWHGLDYRNPYLMLPIQSPLAMLRRFRRQRDALLALFGSHAEPQTLDIFSLQELNPLERRLRALKTALHARGRGKIANAGIRAGLIGLPLLLNEGIATLFRGSLKKPRWSSRALSGSAHELTGPFGIPLFFQLNERRVALKLRGTFGGLRIAVFQAHLHAGPGDGPSSERRAAELEHLAHWVKSELKRSDLVLVAGDFNNDPDSPELAPLKALGLVADSREVTWNPDENPLCHLPVGGTRGAQDVNWDDQHHHFDRVYFWLRPGAVREGSWKMHVRRVMDAEDLSDHYGIAAEITFETPAKSNR